MRMIRIALGLALAAASPLLAGDDRGAQFEKDVRPVLLQFCGDCHMKDKHVPFMQAEKVEQMNAARWAWRSAVSQLRNRTMPPADEQQPTEEQRMKIAAWVETTLRESASTMGDFAGAPISRRLNRLEYDNTIRDLTGLALNFSETFPTEGGGGEGFSNNGETLFLPAILMERYLEAAEQILNSAVITTPLQKTFTPKEMAAVSGSFDGGRLAANDEAAASIGILSGGDYEIQITAAGEKGKPPAAMVLKLDGIAASRFKAAEDGKPASAVLRLQRGIHSLAVRCEDGSATVGTVAVNEKLPKITDAKRAAHKRIFGELTSASIAGMKEDARQAEARRIVGGFMRRAFRRPLKDGEVERFMGLYQRAATRGDPFEEAVKLALKAVLVSPHFIFRVETEHNEPGIFPLSDHELASRLSYFLWASMPDDELSKLADEGKLKDAGVLAKQVERLLSDPKAKDFVEDFTGQWLGTKEVGASVAFASEQFKGIYSSELAADLREEPVQLMLHLIRENKSLFDLIGGDYLFVTERTAKHYGIDGVAGKEHRRIVSADGRRGGLMGLGAVHMITSYPNRTSPVLRGAWVLETVLGVRIPPPPPDVPTLESAKKKTKTPTFRAALELHRKNPSCAACHNLMDPIGFGLENYDLLGRWRDEDAKVKVDASGIMPTGEKFNGPKELRQVLLSRKAEFARNICGKMLGYALGRSLEDRDDVTIEKLADTLAKDDFKARTLIREIALSTPFRNRQGGEAPKKNSTQKKKKEIPAAKAP